MATQEAPVVTKYTDNPMEEGALVTGDLAARIANILLPYEVTPEFIADQWRVWRLGHWFDLISLIHQIDFYLMIAGHDKNATDQRVTK